MKLPKPASLAFFAIAFAIGAEASSLERKDADAVPVAGSRWVEPRTGIEFVWIPGGCFSMAAGLEQPVRQVCLEGFHLGKYEVTQEQYRRIYGDRKPRTEFEDKRPKGYRWHWSHKGASPSKFEGSDRPVERVSYLTAKAVLEAFNRRTGEKFRLPSEAEWEYACRAGGRHAEHCGEGGIDGLAWHEGNSGGRTQPVGKQRPNAWGLHDMTGNVWEWVEDCWHETYHGAPADGAPWQDENGGDCKFRVRRGGSWKSEPGLGNAAFRDHSEIDDSDNEDGFRIVRPLH